METVVTPAPSMRWRRWIAVMLSTLLSVFAPMRADAQQQDLDFEAAARAALRLAPAMFPRVPAPVADALQEEGCSVPQYRFEGGALTSNLISGSFARLGQTDYAALCSREGRTSLLIVWGGPARCPSSVKDAADVDAMVGAGNALVYARQIERADPEQVDVFAHHARALITPAAHDGIRHSVGEYQTSVLYCQAGEWVEIEPEATT